MKNTCKLFIVVLLITFSLSAFGEYVPEVGLFTKEEFTPQSINKIPEILERFHRETPDKNIVLYIHGRGRDTDEEWKNLTRFEKNYGVRVIMFHWPSWKSLLARPVAAAQASATDLSEVFKEIRQYKEENPEIFERIKISLLTHSMGNVVLREYTEKYNSHEGPIFNNWIAAGADVGLTDHKAWVSSVDFAERKYVTMNNRDLTLLLSYLLDLKSKKPFFYKLGLGFGKVKINKIMGLLDLSATYIDLSRSLNVDHRYFESEKPLMLKIFKPIYNGEDVNLNFLGNKVKKENGINYVVD